MSSPGEFLFASHRPQYTTIKAKFSNDECIVTVSHAKLALIGEGVGIGTSKFQKFIQNSGFRQLFTLQGRPIKVNFDEEAPGGSAPGPRHRFTR